MAKIVVLNFIITNALETTQSTMAVKGDDIISVQSTKLRDGTGVTFVALKGNEDLLRVEHTFDDMVRCWERSLC